jgi:hypothetical protein
MKPLEIYAVLEEAYEKVRTLSGNFENVSANSAFAIGEACGILSKAKALVGRDIEDIRERDA